MSKTKRTSLADRELPSYTPGEEIFNMVTHIVGAVFAVVATVLMVVFAAINHNTWGVVSGAIYGVSMFLVYVISSVYHGLSPRKATMGKKVMQVIDHCDIYYLIIGSFAPIALTGLREANPALAWGSFGFVTAVCVIGTVFTAIDFNKYKWISYGSYFLAGWGVLVTAKLMLEVYSWGFIWLLVIGGLVYTSGMIFFVLQTKSFRYFHSIFHLFILGGTVLQFIAIFKYGILGA